MSQAQVDAERHGASDDIRFGQRDEGRMNSEAGASLDAGLGGEISHPGEGLNVFRAAIRVAGVVDCVHTDEYIAGLEHLRPGQREGKKDGVARGHVRDGDAGGNAGDVSVFGDGDIGSERGMAEQPQIDVHRFVFYRAEVRRNAGGGFELNPMPLPVIERKSVAVKAFAPRNREAGSGIKTTAQQTDCFPHHDGIGRANAGGCSQYRSAMNRTWRGHSGLPRLPRLD